MEVLLRLPMRDFILMANLGLDLKFRTHDCVNEFPFFYLEGYTVKKNRAGKCRFTQTKNEHVK